MSIGTGTITIRPPENIMDYVREHIIGVGFFAIFFGSTAWEFSSETYDIFMIYEYSNYGSVGKYAYIYRCIIVGISAASFTCIGIILYGLLFKLKIRIIETIKLWILSFIISGIWQLETDFAGWVAYLIHQNTDHPVKNERYLIWEWSGVKINNEDNKNQMIIRDATFSREEIGMNILVFILCQTFFFFILSRVVRAKWAKKLIDFQVGFGGLGFYLSGLLYGSNVYMNALYAGTITMATSIMPAMVVISVKLFKHEAIFQDNNSLEYNENLMRL